VGFSTTNALSRAHADEQIDAAAVFAA